MFGKLIKLNKIGLENSNVVFRKMSTCYDLAVIGSGPGGYVASIKAAQLGLKTVCIEKSPTLGGTCLNIGCIPSKALLNASHHYHVLKSRKLENFGITCDNVGIDVEKMMSYKNTCVSTLTQGISGLFKYNKVHRIEGSAKLRSVGVVEATKKDGSLETIEAKNIIVATGSEVTPFPGIDIDESQIVSSTGALCLKSVPRHMVVIGGGVIGLELGSVWRKLGSQVTCVEYLNNIGGSTIDSEVAKYLLNLLKKDGITFLLGHKVSSAKREMDKVLVSYENISGSEKTTIPCDVLLVCVGRRPFTQNLGLEDVGVEFDDKGRVIVDKNFETSTKSIYAIGDVIDGPMLAHKAEEDGIACVEGITGRSVHVDHATIPNVIYTHPEVAWVGMNEDDAKKAGIKYKIGKFPLSSNGRSRAVGEIDGFAKVIADADNDTLLGAHFISSCAGEVINQMAMAIHYNATAENIARSCHAHPTIAECLKEACLAAYCGKAINNV